MSTISGRRKEATAVVRLSKGKGNVTVNKKNIDEYFGRDVAKMIVRQPLVLTKEVKEPEILEETKNEEILSPAVRKIVTENNIDIKSVSGSGKDGRILKGDLINLMGTSPPPAERKVKYGQEERIKMSRLRQTIAKRLKQAQENAALLLSLIHI